MGTTYYISYNDKKELIAISKSNNNERIIDSDKIEYLFALMAKDTIIGASVVNDTLSINYTNDKVIINNFGRVLKDKRYAFFKEYLNAFVNDENVKNIIKAREQVMKKLNKNSHKFLKRISITGLAVGVFVFAAYTTMKYIDANNIDQNNDFDIAYEEDYNIGNNGSDYVLDNYKQIIKKYSKKFGVPFEVVQAILAHNIDESSKYVGVEQFGAIMNEFNDYLNQDIAVYDYDNGNSYLYKVTEDDLNSKDNYVKIICMILQYKLMKSHYNIVAAVESLHRDDDVFKYFILKNAAEKNPEYMEKSFFITEYFKYAMENTNDLSWLEIYDLSDGSYARKIFSYISNGTTLEIPHKVGEPTYFTVNMNTLAKTK